MTKSQNNFQKNKVRKSQKNKLTTNNIINNLITTHNLNNIKENDKNQAETKKSSC